MYEGVPTASVAPAAVVPSATTLATPKSSSFTMPSRHSITFEGETSRWMICRFTPSGSRHECA